mgnify:CR=1 FL=1
MKKIPKKINTKECSKSSNSKVFHYKKDVETVLRLTIKQYNEPPFTALNSRAKALSMSPIRNNIKRLSMRKNINSSIKENNNNNIQYDKYRKELNRFSDSLKQLKTSFPNNTEIKELEKSIGIMAPVRLEHIKLENNLKDQIHEIDVQETSLQSTKDLLEAQMITIDRRIMDQELNKEVALEMEKENNNKIIKDKLINELQNQFLSKDKDKENNDNNNIKIKKRTLTSSREFQERLELYMKREEYLTKQKEKEIEKDIINNKQNKKVVIEQLNNINDNLKNLHKIRNFFIQKLYEHYLNVLKDGKDTRNEGLSWVIREIFALDKKVMLSYMPKFLDKCCIKYIFDMTHLNIKITEVENQIKKTKEEFKKVGIINKGDETLVNESIIKANQHKRNLNEITKNYWEKIRQTFGSNNKFINKKNFLNKNLELNLDDNNNNKVNGNKTFKKKSVFLNIPFIAGDPNAITISIPNNEISHINKLLKDGQKQNEKIPDVLKIKDYEKLSHNSGYFLNNEEIKKVQNYLSLKNQLNSLRKKKETMKTNEMTRIFKEFQRNDYENRFNIDKITVISALIGEDNLNSELVKQTKREKKYIEEIMKGRMHKKMKSVDKAMMEKNLLGENINPLNKMVKSMEGFEMNNRVEILSYNKAFENASGQYGLTF